MDYLYFFGGQCIGYYWTIIAAVMDEASCCIRPRKQTQKGLKEGSFSIKYTM
jgi:hypothetical protein